MQSRNRIDLNDHAEQLWSKYISDRSIENRNLLVENYTPFVRWIAKKVIAKIKQSQVIDRDDLISEGAIGLIEAIESYKPNQGCRFTSYSPLRIFGAMHDSLRDSGWVPRLVIIRIKKISSANEKLRSELHRDPSDVEVADKLEISLDEYESWVREQNTIPAIHSASSVITEGHRSKALEDLITDHCPPPDWFMHMRDQVELAIRPLSQTAKRAVTSYFIDGKTMKEAGAELGLGESRISQIIKQSIPLMKDILNGQ